MHKDGIQQLIMEQNVRQDNQKKSFVPDKRMQATTSHHAANSVIEDVVNQERARGYQEGYNEGLKIAQVEWDSKLAIVNQIIQSSEQLLKDVDGEIETKLLEISVSIAKQIIRRELSIDSGQIVSTVKKALELIPNNEHEITVYIHPNDEACINEVFSQYLDSDRFAIFKDPTIEVGGCKVSTDYSLVDLSIDAQIASIAASFLGDQRTREKK